MKMTLFVDDEIIKDIVSIRFDQYASWTNMILIFESGDVRNINMDCSTVKEILIQ